MSACRRGPLHRPSGGPPLPEGEETQAATSRQPADASSPLPLGEGDQAQPGGEGYTPRAPKKTFERAKRLRRQLTPPEARLWVALRIRPSGLKFRRQHPVGPYILDFFCDEAKLGIEVDGASHDFGDRPAHDIVRDAYLARLGIRVLRFLAEDVRVNIEMVLDTIVAVADERRGPLHHPSGGPPLPKGEETQAEPFRETLAPASPLPSGEGDQAKPGGEGSPR